MAPMRTERSPVRAYERKAPSADFWDGVPMYTGAPAPAPAPSAAPALEQKDSVDSARADFVYRNVSTYKKEFRVPEMEEHILSVVAQDRKWRNRVRAWTREHTRHGQKSVERLQEMAAKYFAMLDSKEGKEEKKTTLRMPGWRQHRKALDAQEKRAKKPSRKAKDIDTDRHR
ncbi:hypothetical protein K504DRAFT_303706 [Pleomassaria siparia CBS 279.74]|uniref:Uncharacterized protein n=1 Tax=Pleomassaria siparia CBS 279.74 TaxID=1314801 RepID=A0A6G1K784_9PLEO|nr:hypothetical protein K504DRAFT_303706 [Pleomassaria siparia CBS 279.74]